MAEEKKLKKELPEEMMLEIALRLPAKSVGQFKSVSKPWKSFLSSPNFVKSHLHHQLRRAPERFIVTDKSTENRQIRYTPHVITPAATAGGGSSRAVPFPTLQGHEDVELLGCCNGLALLNVGPYDGKDGLVVINPTTATSTEIFKYKQPMRTQMRFGLDYSNAEDDYQIVLLSYLMRSRVSNVSVFSLKKRCWKKIYFKNKRSLKESADLPYLHHEWEPAVYANGRLHWLAYKRKFTRFAALVIVAFDLSTLKLVEVPPPTGFVFQLKLHHFSLAVMGGCLAILDRNYPIEVYILEKSGSAEMSWRKFTIANQCDHEPKCGYNVVGMLGDEFVLAKNDEELVAYNCETGVWRDMDIHGLPEKFETGRISSFKESLGCPNYCS